MSEAHKPFTISRKSGSEVFHHGGQPIGCKILDFWSWAYSDYLGNTERGAFAEFIVAADLGRMNQVRQGWSPFDLKTSDGVKIEVKQSAYLQAWNQKKHSKIIFSIRPTRAWNFQTDVMEKDVRRQADVYVFCVLANKDPKTLDPLDVGQWKFYVLHSSLLNNKVKNQKTIGLESLLRIGAQQCDFGSIADTIRKAVQS